MLVENDGAQSSGEELSLHDELARAFQGASEGGAGQEQQSAGAEPAQAAPAPDGGQLRTETGQFAKKPEAGQKSSEQQPQAGAEQVASPAIRPPASWSAAAKSAFAALDPIVQQEVLKREKDIEDGAAQWQTKGERLNRLDTVLAPRRERFQLAGVDEIQAIQALFAAQDLLERDPYSGLAYLARQYGVDLRRFTGGMQAQPGQAPAQQPQLQQLIQAAVQQSLQPFQAELSQQRQHVQQQAQAPYVAQVSAFASDPKNLYFENVRSQMIDLLQAGRASTLEAAYDMACWSDPNIRGLLQKQQATDAEQAARAKADAARRAGGSTVGSPAPGSIPAGSGPAPSLREELSRAWREAS